MSRLTKDDLVILRDLQRDGRISFAELSRTTGIPDSTIHDRIKRLISRGVIKKFTAVLNYEAVGMNIVALIGIETGAKLYHRVAETLCGFDEIVEVYGTTAEFDLMIKVRTSTRAELSNVLNQIRKIDGVDDIYVSSILEIFKEEHAIPLKEPMER